MKLQINIKKKFRNINKNNYSIKDWFRSMRNPSVNMKRSTKKKTYEKMANM